ncbi:hypothetical protein B566_EDAN009371 [Ephemera danica]|nr:hypothetical protein B566_EDAN009371 [Ephemera danica]
MPPIIKILVIAEFSIAMVFSYWVLNRQMKLMKHQQGMENLKGKVVLITGASSGLGEAFAHVFHKAGCRLVLAARREAELCRVRDDLIRINPETAHPVVLNMDMLEHDKLPYLAQKSLEIYGHIDIFISNAGITTRCTIQDCGIEVHKKFMDVNYFGHVALTKALLPSMLERKTGHIVVIGSILGQISIPHRAPYSASKHALQAFCDSLRAEVATMYTTNPGGMTAEYVADRILHAVVSEEPELVIANFQHRILITIRKLFPNLYFSLMAYRAKTTN